MKMNGFYVSELTSVYLLLYSIQPSKGDEPRWQATGDEESVCVCGTWVCEGELKNEPEKEVNSIQSNWLEIGLYATHSE